MLICEHEVEEVRYPRCQQMSRGSFPKEMAAASFCATGRGASASGAFLTRTRSAYPEPRGPGARLGGVYAAVRAALVPAAFRAVRMASRRVRDHQGAYSSFVSQKSRSV